MKIGIKFEIQIKVNDKVFFYVYRIARAISLVVMYLC
ncbi:hypothetical protein Q672_10560 [Marinobacter sp. EVN1]|nr:hypothetical protein Q672_10560 [Marinobacter sp. EVN1]